jgi:hypothetical protein
MLFQNFFILAPLITQAPASQLHRAGPLTTLDALPLSCSPVLVVLLTDSKQGTESLGSGWSEGLLHGAGCRGLGTSMYLARPRAYACPQQPCTLKKSPPSFLFAYCLSLSFGSSTSRLSAYLAQCYCLSP